MDKCTIPPWRTEWLDDEHGYILDAEGNYLAEIVTFDEEGRYRPDEMKANAELMAAAPELLWACKALAERLNEADGCRAPMFLENAIAKAEGGQDE